MGLVGRLARMLSRDHDEVLVDGDYELRVRVSHRGTRSEGRTGRLYHRGREVTGRAVGEEVQGPAHRFVFRGEDRPHLWSTSGWEAVARPSSAPTSTEDGELGAPG